VIPLTDKKVHNLLVIYNYQITYSMAFTISFERIIGDTQGENTVSLVLCVSSFKWVRISWSWFDYYCL